MSSYRQISGQLPRRVPLILCAIEKPESVKGKIVITLENLKEKTKFVYDKRTVHLCLAKVLRPPDYVRDSQLTVAQAEYCRRQLVRLLDLCRDPELNEYVYDEIIQLVVYCNDRIKALYFPSTTRDCVARGVFEERFRPELFHKFSCFNDKLQRYASAIIRTGKPIDISGLPQHMLDKLRRLHVNIRESLITYY